MFSVVRRAAAALLFVINAIVPGPVDSRPAATVDQPARSRTVIQRPIPRDGRSGALRFARTELYFGTARPGDPVTAEEFRAFIDLEVTPRFPDGLTLVEADGQFRGEDGNLVKERSYVLILLYPQETFAKATGRIERIRALYKDQFQQESVLRVDDPFVVWVSF